MPIIEQGKPFLGMKPPAVGDRAPQFDVPTPLGTKSLHELAADRGTLALVTIDSYHFHPG